VLYRVGVAAPAEFGERGVARIPVHPGGAHLDEFVRGERTLDLGAHRVGEALSAQENQRL